MSASSNRSIAARLTRMNLIVSGAVLVIAALAFFLFDLVSFRQNLIHNLKAEAQIIGENTVSALTFNDQESAAATLRALERAPDVQGAAITTVDGRTFAYYGMIRPEDAAEHPLGSQERDRTWRVGTNVLVAHRIIFQGKALGSVYIYAQLREIQARARQYLAISGVILLFCMAAAMVISSLSQRLIVKPIAALAETAAAVSRDQDYSVRAPGAPDGSEIGLLVGAFNNMLQQIQTRDKALNEARSGLEIRVKERTAELEAANRELNAFSYTVAHDLRGPLDVISGIAYLLAQHCAESGDTNVKFMVEQLKASTANMGSLIDDLLNLARASTIPIELSRVDLTAIAKSIAAELRSSAPERQVNFIIGETPEGLADPGLMRIVLDNLLRNSWKYTSHHSQASIEFGAKRIRMRDGDDDRLVYFVRDDGAGFNSALIDRLFQPFQRLHDKSDFPGTGIGLATVQRVLVRQGGSIWADGAVEEGAIFYFTLPTNASPHKDAVG